VSVSRKAAYAILALAGIVFVSGLLVGPRVPSSDQQKECVRNLKLAGPFGLSLNCDSGVFIADTHEPVKLLEPSSKRQSRPGIIFATHLVSIPLRPVNLLVHRFFSVRADSAYSTKLAQFADSAPELLAYVLVNVALLFLGVSVLLLLWNVTGPVPVALLPLAFLVVANDMVKAFFWSPHTQLFNIVVPLIATWLAVRAWQNDLIYERRAYWIAAGLSLGQTAYATFVVTLAALILPSIVRHYRDKQVYLRAVVIASIFFLPTVLWMAIVYAQTGQAGYYTHETQQYAQVVWIFDHDPLEVPVIFLRHFGRVLKLFWGNNWLLFLATLALFALARARNVFEAQDTAVVLSACAVSAAMAFFWALVGFHPWRMAFTLLPPFFVIAGLSVLRLFERTRHTAVLSFATYAGVGLWAIWTVAKYGPNS
jgi:hypothetical protein